MSRPQPGENKRGALGNADMKFIEDNVDKLTVDEIAKILNRNRDPILRHIKMNKLGAAFNKVREVGEKTPKDVLRELRGKKFYTNLKSQITLDELYYFDDHWVAMVTQFNGDLLPSEEMELKELLILEILKNRENASERRRLEEKDILERALAVELKLPRDERDRDNIAQIRAQLSAITIASREYLKGLKDLCDRAEKMRRALHASRQDRAKTLDNAKADFVSWLKSLEDYRTKIRTGREMEILRQAKEKERRRLSEFHTYITKEVEQPILNADTVE